ncbi:hypothetical protein [Bradyrhizobium sp. CER78]|uniref:hypothetical protein n=1 Tax=Bradyrhizobium sp. CER78 TaxID=3039162 RepID=UPI00244B6D33|nr:hypothetical protein [Bradyrhizobium sp. CER78]MDH2386744.1 hypothetical protein [Bradyrhizobium sp. CER78]
MLKQQALGRVVIDCFQPVKGAAIARMLHDAGCLAQFFEASLRRKELEFDFRLIAMPDGNGIARIGHDRLPLM